MIKILLRFLGKLVIVVFVYVVSFLGFITFWPRALGRDWSDFRNGMRESWLFLTGKEDF